MEDPASSSADDEPRSVMISFGKGLDSTPIFLKKTYKMIDTCDPSIASWSDDGDRFVVKDPDAFAKKAIPMFFDHSKLSSFARQLTFYGFQRTRPKPYRKETSNHFIFFSEKFQRGRYDLLRTMRRSPRHTSKDTPPGDESGGELLDLHSRVVRLEQQVADQAIWIGERLHRARVDMLARMDQMILAVQLQEPAQSTLDGTPSAFSLQTLPTVWTIDSAPNAVNNHPFLDDMSHPKLSCHEQTCQVMGYQGGDIADVPMDPLVPSIGETSFSWFASDVEHVDMKQSGVSTASMPNGWEDEIQLLLALDKNLSNHSVGDRERNSHAVVDYQGGGFTDIPMEYMVSPPVDTACSLLDSGSGRIDSKQSVASSTSTRREWEDELELWFELDNNFSSLSDANGSFDKSMLTDAGLVAIAAVGESMVLVEDVVCAGSNIDGAD